MSFRISREAFEYLSVQVGELDGLKAVRYVWEGAYERNLMARMDNILTHLPRDCRSVLDIGSGLGGIDVLLYRWYERQTKITLLDGGAFAPSVKNHNVPFNSKKVALEFLQDNGVRSDDMSFMEHDNLKPQPFDLIVSFRAWCFHIAPRVYLDFVLRCAHENTVIIIDLRKEQTWIDELSEKFKGRVIEIGEKFDRWVLTVQPSSLLLQADGASTR
jgi:SAM-dependent methyltransferase